MVRFGPSELASARDHIQRGLAEDAASRDLSTQIAIPADAVGEFVVRVRADGRLSGLETVALTIGELDSRVEVSPAANDGDAVEAETVVARLAGPVAPILTAERTFLNLLGSLSGIASLTAQFVEAAGDHCKVLDTRKTWPGARVLQKYAVRCGGGVNHRVSLEDMILLKDNHRDGTNDWSGWVKRAREEHPDVPIEIEVDSLDQLDQILELPLDRIMLDNFEPGEVVEAVRRRGDRPMPLEVSGGVTLERVAALAAAGADFVSVGALTHSAPNLDVGLDRTS